MTNVVRVSLSLLETQVVKRFTWFKENLSKVEIAFASTESTQITSKYLSKCVGT